jgi:hypothetical protein
MFHESVEDFLFTSVNRLAWSKTILGFVHLGLSEVLKLRQNKPLQILCSRAGYHYGPVFVIFGGEGVAFVEGDYPAGQVSVYVFLFPVLGIGELLEDSKFVTAVRAVLIFA